MIHKRWIKLENQIETLYLIIASLAILSAGFTTFFLRQFLLTKNKIPNEIQSLIRENQARIQELQSNIRESQGTVQEHQTTIQKLQAQLKLKDTRSFQVGQNSANGGIAEFLGGLHLSIIQKFDTLCALASTSKKPSVDAIGFNDDGITFIEFKKSGANLTSKENKIKKLIGEGKVNYEIVDVNLPDDLTTIREPKCLANHSL